MRKEWRRNLDRLASLLATHDRPDLAELVFCPW